MPLFSISDKKLTPVREKSIAFEKPLQGLIE
jgi:hypothetical protein